MTPQGADLVLASDAPHRELKFLHSTVSTPKPLVRTVVTTGPSFISWRIAVSHYLHQPRASSSEPWSCQTHHLRTLTRCRCRHHRRQDYPCRRAHRPNVRDLLVDTTQFTETMTSTGAQLVLLAVPVTRPLVSSGSAAKGCRLSPQELTGDYEHKNLLHFKKKKTFHVRGRAVPARRPFHCLRQ